jgi:hypothetical protein
LPESVRRLRIFAASPGDVDDERKRLDRVVEDLRIHIAAAHGLDLELVRWETHMRPGAGDDAQAVITPQIGPYDLFIGIFWNRFGGRHYIPGIVSAIESLAENPFPLQFNGKLDFELWEQIFYGEFNGRRKKRVLGKITRK